jgi:glycosyltransferase involved in cell wall biosynthesis
MIKIASLVLNNFKNDSRVLKESLSLANNGYKVEVLALHEENLAEHEKLEEISIHRVKLLTKNWPKNIIASIVKYMEFSYRVYQRCKSFDIIHCNDLNALPIGYMIKKFYNKEVKIVYDAHEYETQTNGLAGLQKKLTIFLEKNLIKHADAVICVSDSIANEYVKLYGIEKPALILNAPLYQAVKKENLLREELNIEKEKRVFLYQGALTKGRGIETLLEAFETLEDKSGAVVFMGYGALEERIQQAALKSENIFYHKAVRPEIVLRYTSSADYGVSMIEDSCLSYRYCLPNKLFEYAMANLPVIVSNLPEMRRVVEENKIGVVAKESGAQGMKKAIEEIVKLDYKELQRNLKSVQEEYNWQEQERTLLELYGGLYESRKFGF